MRLLHVALLQNVYFILLICSSRQCHRQEKATKNEPVLPAMVGGAVLALQKNVEVYVFSIIIKNL